MSLTPSQINNLAEAVAEIVLARLVDQDDSARLLDIQEAAKLMNCSVATLERYTANKRIPSLKIGRLRRYRRSDLIGRGAGDER